MRRTLRAAAGTAGRRGAASPASCDEQGFSFGPRRQPLQAALGADSGSGGSRFRRWLQSLAARPNVASGVGRGCIRPPGAGSGVGDSRVGTVKVGSGMAGGAQVTAFQGRGGARSQPDHVLSLRHACQRSACHPHGGTRRQPVTQNNWRPRLPVGWQRGPPRRRNS